MKIIKLLCTLILLSLTPFFTLAAGNGPLSFSLQATKKSTSTSEINVVITNTSDEFLKVLKWNTPLETELSADIFSISADGKFVTYQGRLIKRGEPEETDYVTFKPRESKTVSVDLSRYYKMDQANYYSVYLDGYVTAIVETANKTNSTINTTQVESTDIEETSNSLKIFFQPNTVKKIQSETISTNYESCSSSQINTLNSSLNAAVNIASAASSALNSASNPTSAPRYTTWFGSANSSRQNTVTAHFQSISNALSSAPIRLSCACNDNYYAYVYPNDPYKIYVCNAFWSAPLTGTDSKAGTLVHEMSHFYVVANTDDYAYGQSSAKRLARTSPGTAIQNADSHEYFAENTPSLSMY
ncbi:M35 family metallo-endopeptidase [Gynuella sunshinyii]|uniref:Lysine-specific metallo-endopeptidase domain-containing protein n=1 Tax=Gynuella sunshinyii YC6258 TaxID=1445510 RepID=A0A0C5VEM8_9GAMM|nr:M35 family metallo-endopeptidase [Gynuella sunshinyii]AJQ97720.1 hypothetical Protein YC6258_05692 [Gynuella sunshinyii YC6258]